MTTSSRNSRRSKLIISLVIILSIISFFGLFHGFSVLEISSPKKMIPVHEGDVLVHSYTHSMYGAPVSERFTIQNSRLKLISVDTPNVAVLEYFGLNTDGVGHLNLVFDSFMIPAASIGAHLIKVGDIIINLRTGEDRDEKILVRIRKTNAIEYYMELIWG